jgi:hypothetical protein
VHAARKLGRCYPCMLQNVATTGGRKAGVLQSAASDSQSHLQVSNAENFRWLMQQVGERLEATGTSCSVHWLHVVHVYDSFGGPHKPGGGGDAEI